MKTQLAVLGLILAQPCIGSPFINLAFDEPDLTGSLTPIHPGGPLEGNTSEILRGWSLTVDGQPKLRMEYAPPGTGGGSLAYLVNNPAGSLLGPHSLTLFSPFPSTPEIRVGQTGTIPAEATGLWIGASGRIDAFANGEKIGGVTLEGNSSVILDVARFAGQEVSLEFSLRFGGGTRFDILGFTPIPEPSTWALCGVGATAMFPFARR